jgi:hypothetical protein
LVMEQTSYVDYVLFFGQVGQAFPVRPCVICCALHSTATADAHVACRNDECTAPSEPQRKTVRCHFADTQFCPVGMDGQP